MTAESDVKKEVKRILAQYGAYPYMPVQTRMSKRSIDFIVCYNGLYLGIETKAAGNEPTPEQNNTMRDMKASGGHVLVIDERNLWMLVDWLEWNRTWISQYVGPHEYVPPEQPLTNLTGA